MSDYRTMKVSFKEITKYSDATYACVRAEDGGIIRISGGVRLAKKLEKAWTGLTTFAEHWEAARECNANISFNSY